jgi:hypothetical protein
MRSIAACLHHNAGLAFFTVAGNDASQSMMGITPPLK